MSSRRRAFGRGCLPTLALPSPRMDVRARAEIRSGHICVGRLALPASDVWAVFPTGRCKCEGSRLYDGHGTAPFERSWATDERAAPITARSRSAIVKASWMPATEGRSHRLGRQASEKPLKARGTKHPGQPFC